MGRSGLKKAGGRALTEDSRSSSNRNSKSSSSQKPKSTAKSQSKSATPTTSKSTSTANESLIPLELQQLLLDVFRNVFENALSNEDDLKKTLQEVKGALYERDFEKAFGKEEFLEAYAVRWSPSRALCYQSILVDLYDHLRDLLPRGKEDNKTFRTVCFGGGAAEIVAFAGFLRYLQDCSSSDSPPVRSKDPVKIEESTSEDQLSQTLQDTSLSSTLSTPHLDLTLLDVANWASVVQKLETGLFSPTFTTSTITTESPTTPSLIHSSTLTTTFTQANILSFTPADFLTHIPTKQPLLLTLLFTLNELYTSSISKTTAFLLKLTMAVAKDTLLLVVDSPGSYSEAKVGKSEEGKKYPMKWLVDHVLLGEGEGKDGAEWEKIVEDDSRWFRLPEGLSYPIALENMRYQIHLYRRL